MKQMEAKKKSILKELERDRVRIEQELAELRTINTGTDVEAE